MSAKLFEYAVIYNPRAKEEVSKLVIEPTTVLAKSEKEANFIAARAVPEDYVGKLDQLEIAVRPF